MAFQASPSSHAAQVKDRREDREAQVGSTKIPRIFLSRLQSLLVKPFWNLNPTTVSRTAPLVDPRRSVVLFRREVSDSREARRLIGRGNVGCLPRLSGIFTGYQITPTRRHSTWFPRFGDYQNKGVGNFHLPQFDSIISKTYQGFFIAGVREGHDVNCQSLTSVRPLNTSVVSLPPLTQIRIPELLCTI